MERLLVVRCPDLLELDEGGQALRRFARVHDAVAAFCPWVAVVRPGVCSLPAKGPARFFGGEEELVGRIREATSREDTLTEIGVAEGLFAADLAAQAGVIVPPGDTPAFLAPWPVAVLGRADLDRLLPQLGIDTLGAFAELPERHVLGRLGTDGAACHRVARGEHGELPGQRATDAALDLAALGDTAAPAATQEGFWSDREGSRRAARVLVRLQQLLGPGAVEVPRLRGGRPPDDQAEFVTWSPVYALVPTRPAPWPGTLPSPAPALVHRQPVAVELAGDDGPVTVTAAGELTGDPVRLSVAGGRWSPVEGWAGPWPAAERWWGPAAGRPPPGGDGRSGLPAATDAGGVRYWNGRNSSSLRAHAAAAHPG